jgi:hypothetical protein
MQGAEDSPTAPYIVEADTDVVTVRMDNVKEGWEQWFLLQSDEHWDNPHCDRRLLKHHHELALTRNAGIFKFGDTFCLMQGKYDPRADKSSLRPEHQGSNYFDLVHDTAVEWYRPYAKNIIMVGYGNHETASMKRHEIDLLGRFCKQLGIHAAGYSGFVRFMFSRNGSGKSSKILYYHHGFGGGGPVTKGVIGTNRRSVIVPDATIVCTGHLHEEWQVTQQRIRLSSMGKPYQDEQLHIQLPTYKDEFDLRGGYHVENGRPPKPLGGVWLRFFYQPYAHSNIGYEVVRAK